MSRRPLQQQKLNPMNLDQILNNQSGPGSSTSTSSLVGTSSTSIPLVQSSAYPTYSSSSPPTEPNRQPALRRASTARDPRPAWPEEHAYFVWYCRTDLAQSWDQVLQSFEKQFGRRRAKGGLQCKFYRVLEHWKVPKVREQNRAGRQQVGGSKGGENGVYGLVQRTHLRYPWMETEHRIMPPLAEFASATTHPSSLTPSPCQGCPLCGGGQET